VRVLARGQRIGHSVEDSFERRARGGFAKDLLPRAVLLGDVTVHYLAEKFRLIAESGVKLGLLIPMAFVSSASEAPS